MNVTCKVCTKRYLGHFEFCPNCGARNPKSLEPKLPKPVKPWAGLCPGGSKMALDKYEIGGIVTGIALSLILAFFVPVPPMRAHGFMTFAQYAQWELAK